MFWTGRETRSIFYINKKTKDKDKKRDQVDIWFNVRISNQETKNKNKRGIRSIFGSIFMFLIKRQNTKTKDKKRDL